MSDRAQRRLALAILALGVAVYLAALNVRGAMLTIEPGTTVTYGAVARLPDVGGWTYLRTGGHVSVGYTEVECLSNGQLEVRYEPLAAVASAWVSPDETLTRRGILAGASVGLTYSRILFTRVTDAGPVAVSCASSTLRGDVANVWLGLVGVAP